MESIVDLLRIGDWFGIIFLIIFVHIENPTRMKKTYAIDFVINLLIILFFYLFLLLITSCKKENQGTPGDLGKQDCAAISCKTD
jgi:hypothetical protein